ncbi:MAG: exodeoxyribonuclease VII large subunit [Alistipes sp.]|nr:exodeoxyribonuclease VII large subunit [Alistipes sp.]
MNEPLRIFTSQRESLTLLDLQRMVRATLESRFEEPMWLRAEISELKVNRSGHCYLNLVEKGASNAAPRAEARAVIWRTAYNSIASKFECATGQALTAGIAVLVRVLVTYHEVYGFSLQIIDLDADYTLGEVERRRRETIERLQKDGVWDMNREVELAEPTLRIAIISSATAAGFQDFRQEIARSPYRFKLTLFESLMQGGAAERSIIDALCTIAEREQEFDAVVIIRGGGSTSDLALFDSYDIATYVAQFPLPVFTGIGHDKDISVVDMVAHTSCKTPTAVATTLIELADEQMYNIEECAMRLRDSVIARINSERLRLERQSNDVVRCTTLLLSGLQHRLDSIDESIATEAQRQLQIERQRLDSLDEIVASHNPEIILRRGFAIVRDSEGRAVKMDNISIGSNVNIELIDGNITANVTDRKTKRKRCQPRK